MDHLLPILSEEEYKAEIKLCDEAIDPDEVDNVIKRWLRLYLPILKPGELTQEALDIIKCRDTHTEKMTKLSRRYRILMEHQKSSTNQLNVSASDAYTTHAEPSTSSSSVTAPPAHSPGTPTFTPLPSVASLLPMKIPNLPTSSSSSVTEPPATPTFTPPSPPASSLPMRIPNLPTTSRCSVTAPPAHSTGTPTFNPLPPVASLLRMQIPNLPTSSSSSVTEPPATPTFTPPSPPASSLPMQIPNLPTTSRCSVTAPLAHSPGTPTFTPLPSVASLLPMPTTSRCSVTAPPVHSTGTPTFTPPPRAASSLPMRIPNLPTTSSSSVTAPPVHSTGTPTINPPRPVASSTPMQTQNLPPTDDCKYTVIGPNGTRVSTRVFQDISFKEPTTATRRLLSLVFTEEVLAKNTLSGKPSPAFRGRERPLKGQLDPDKVSDVIYCITSRTDFIEKNVRTVITAKCSDSAKKIKKLQQKQK